MKSEKEQHPLALSALLHLLPGGLILAVFVFLGLPAADALGLPPALGFALVVPLFQIPFMLGGLVFLGWRRNGRLSLQGVVLFRNRLPPGRLALRVSGLFLFAVAVIYSLSFVDRFLLERFFSWVPEEYLLRAEIVGFPPLVLMFSHLASLLLVGIAGPVIEELYFRGYLLPRLSHLGPWAPLWNTFFFILYHFWSPWRFVTRMIFSFPIAWAVWRHRSISIGIWTHCSGNVAGELLSLAAVLGLVAN